MSTLDQYKKQWEQCSKSPAYQKEVLDQVSLQRIITSRVRKQTKASFRYFWASFALQTGVYAMCSHLIVRHWPQTHILWPSLLGILLYLPFTVVLMKKFKQIARIRLKGNEQTSIRDYVSDQYQLLNRFFTFKKRYEMVLIPLSAAIGVALVFTLYVPGGVAAFPVGACMTYFFTLVACYLAIRAENHKSFVQPLQQLTTLLQEYQE